MSKATKVAKSFTIDPGVFTYIVRTALDRSVSSRLNELLQRAILEEQYDQLEREAQEFFGAHQNASRRETRAFHKASMRSLARD